MRAWGAAALAVLAVAIIGCSAEVPDGRFICADDRDCPTDFHCVRARCYSGLAPPGDAGVPVDASLGMVTPCGTQGLVCCALPMEACPGGQLFCDIHANICRPCGAMGQPCCIADPIGTCRDADAACVDDSCIHCGGPEEPCCGAGDCTAAGMTCCGFAEASGGICAETCAPKPTP